VTQACKPGHFLLFHVHPDVAYTTFFMYKTLITSFTKNSAAVIFYWGVEKILKPNLNENHNPSEIDKNK